MKRESVTQAGFTLVEMLVLAVSMPFATKSSHHQKLGAAATQLTALFSSAQTQAHISNSVVQVTFDRNARTWSMMSGRSPLHIDASIKVTILTIDEAVSERQAGYVFFPEGGNSGGRVLLEADNSSSEISLNWLTGTITTHRVGSSP
jgi:general secretion pathway protein H